jgi:hypothetical protein
MSQSDAKPLVDRQIEAEEYLKTHKINELFNNITSHLVFNKPGKAKTNMNFFIICFI